MDSLAARAVRRELAAGEDHGAVRTRLPRAVAAEGNCNGRSSVGGVGPALNGKRAADRAEADAPIGGDADLAAARRIPHRQFAASDKDGARVNDIAAAHRAGKRPAVQLKRIAALGHADLLGDLRVGKHREQHLTAQPRRALQRGREVRIVVGLAARDLHRGHRKLRIAVGADVFPAVFLQRMLALRDGEILQLRHSAQVRKAHLIAVCVAADIARRKHIGNGQRRIL